MYVFLFSMDRHLADKTSLLGESFLDIHTRFIHPKSFEHIEQMIHCVVVQGTDAVDILNAVDIAVVERNLDTSHSMAQLT